MDKHQASVNEDDPVSKSIVVYNKVIVLRMLLITDKNRQKMSTTDNYRQQIKISLFIKVKQY